MLENKTPNAKEEYQSMADHVALLRASLKRCTGLDLVPAYLDKAQAAVAVFNAPWSLLSHSADDQPHLTYTNRTGARVFNLRLERLTKYLSSETTLPEDRPKREQLLKHVREHGYADHYSGVRVTTDGVKFIIKDAVVWNLSDTHGRYLGQAAMFKRWRYLP